MKTYTLEKTTNKDLLRVVNRDGDWIHYFHKPSQKYLKAVNFILDTGYPKGPGFMKYLLGTNREEAEKRLKSAGDRGDAVHQLIAKILIKGGTFTKDTPVFDKEVGVDRKLSNSEWDCILAFESFWSKHKPKVLVSEFSVFNLNYEFAGTLDAVIVLTKKCDIKTCKCDQFIGKPGLFDWKTSGGIYSSYGAQVSSYGMGENLTKHLGKKYKLQYSAILRIGTGHKTTNGYEFRPYSKEESRENWLRFKSAKMITDGEVREFNPVKEIYEIPEKLSFKVEKIDPTPKPTTKKKVTKKVKEKANAKI